MSNKTPFDRDTIIGYFKSGKPIRRTELKPGTLFLECSFEKACFDSEIISVCDFKDCNFESASMKSSRFSNCTFTGSSLDGLNAEDAVFDNCSFSSGTTLNNSFLRNTQILLMEGSIEFHGSKVEGLTITLGEQGSFRPQFKLLGEPEQVPEGYFLSSDPWTTFSGKRKCYLNVSFNRIVNDVLLKEEQKIAFKLKSKLGYVGWQSKRWFNKNIPMILISMKADRELDKQTWQ